MVRKITVFVFLLFIVIGMGAHDTHHKKEPQTTNAQYEIVCASTKNHSPTLRESANLRGVSFNFSNLLIATKQLKKKFAFVNNLFKHSNSFEFFESIILFDKKIVTHLADNCQLLKR